MSWSTVLETAEQAVSATNWQQPVDDTVTMSDAVKFDRAIVVADSVTMSDSVKFDRSNVIADSVTMSDGATPESGKAANPADSVTMSDAQTFDRGVGIADTVTMSDAQAFQRSVTIADTVTMSDNAGLGRGLAVADSVTMSDGASAQRGLAVNIGDWIAVTDGPKGKKGMRVDATLSLATMQSRLDALKLIGVEHVRATAAWPTIETADETFSWTTTDRVFTQASNRGMSVSFTVDGMPGWLNGNGYWTPPRTGTELAQWTAFATTMAARYAAQGQDGSGPIYECWNEPDQGVFWQAQGGGSAPDPAEYATVLQAFYTGIKAGDPNARVAGMINNRTRLGYLDDVYDALESQFGVAACRANNYYFDVLGLHPYCLTHPPDYPTTDDTTDTWGVVARRFLDFSRAYDLVYTREGVHKPLIMGEFGYSTTSGSNGPITDATRATYVPLAYQGIRDAGYVHSLTWYTYADASNADFDIQSTTTETAYAAVATSDATLLLESGKGVSDSVTMSDSVAFQRSVTIADSVTMSDAQAFQRAISPADSVAMSDAQAFTISFVVSDTVTMSDSVSAGGSLTQNVNDSVTMSDSVAFQRSVTVTDTITMSDAATPSLGVIRTIADTITMSDSRSLGFGVGVTDTITITDFQFFGVPAKPPRTRSTGSNGGGHGRTRSRNTTQGATSSRSLQIQRTRITAFGYSNQVLGGVDPLVVEGLIGRTFTGLRQNQAYTTTGWSTAASEYDAGRTTTYRSIQFDTVPGGWAAAATGAADATLLTTMANLRATNRWNAANPAIISIHHEATLSPFGTTGFSATDYINMWQHLVPLLDTNGYTVHDRFGVYNPNGIIELAYVGWDRMFVGANGIGPPTAGQGVNDLDPDTGLPAGQTLYRYLGSDVYNPIDSPGVLRYGTNAMTLLQPLIDAAVTRNKDFIIGEMACEDGTTTTDHQNKAAWLDSLQVGLITRGSSKPGVCRALLTTIKASAENYNVDSSAESLAAYQRLGASTYFK